MGSVRNWRRWWARVAVVAAAGSLLFLFLFAMTGMMRACPSRIPCSAPAWPRVGRGGGARLCRDARGCL